MRWAGHVARMGEKRKAFRFWGGNPEGNRPPERPRLKWKYSIKINLEELGVTFIDRNH